MYHCLKKDTVKHILLNNPIQTFQEDLIKKFYGFNIMIWIHGMQTADSKNGSF